MAHTVIKEWIDMFEGQPSEAVIRQHFEAIDCRVSSSSLINRGSTISGGQRKGLCFVLQGQCEFAFAHETIQINAGQHAELPHGKYILTVAANADAKLVKVFKLPKPGTPEWDRAVLGEE